MLNAIARPAGAEAYEAEHVHDVYNQIADHFSATRHKPWPIVARFLQSQPAGAVGLDVGCGNGKYLSIDPSIFIVASDRSDHLIAIAAQHARSAALVADGLALPHPLGRFDFAISIAVVHHFSTCERRVEAIRATLETLRPPNERPGARSGQALFFVWALEQRQSRRGWGEGDAQDVMVPWVRKDAPSVEGLSTTFQRYYHLYRQGELEADVQAAGGTALEFGYERDNWWAIAARHPG